MEDVDAKSGPRVGRHAPRLPTSSIGTSSIGGALAKKAIPNPTGAAIPKG